MLEKLQELVNNTHTRAVSQVLLSKKNTDLYQWVLKESNILPTCSIKEKIYFVLNGKPEIICHNGKKRTFNIRTHQYGFCDNISKCACFAKNASDTKKGCDTSHMVNKRVETWIKNYGVENVSQSPVIQKKRAKTIKSRNYTKLYKQLAFDKQTAGFDQVVSRVSSHVTPNFSREEYKGSFRKNFYSWCCITCNSNVYDHIDYGRIPRCTSCYPYSKSKGESELRSYLDSKQVNYIANDRSILGELEYDLYLPDKKVAIEFNGVYWHSTEFKNKDYHVNKFLRSVEKGIHLISIFEDEWINKKDIVLARLESVLGFSKTIPARKCKVTTLTSKEYYNFINKNHLQGKASSTYKYGLIYQDKIVAVMSFSKSRYTKDNYELVRYCSTDTVIGGASKLFKYFVKEVKPNSIISYANRCWSLGKLYHKLGFEDVTENLSNTGYWYIKNNIRYHRSNFTKKKLIEVGADPLLSESTLMENYGYLKIYDCGNYKFRWKSVA